MYNFRSKKGIHESGIDSMYKYSYTGRKQPPFRMISDGWTGYSGNKADYKQNKGNLSEHMYDNMGYGRRINTASYGARPFYDNKAEIEWA